MPIILARAKRALAILAIAAIPAGAAFAAGGGNANGGFDRPARRRHDGTYPRVGV